LRLDPLSPVRSAARAARRRRRRRPDAPATIIPIVDRPAGSRRAAAPGEDLSPGATAPDEGLSLVRLDAARDRLRAAIPPRADED
jgi:hypothetical protein